MARKRKNWRKFLSQQRRLANYTAGIEAMAIEARLQARLPATWTQVETEWQARDAADSYLPQQRHDYLIAVAIQHQVSLAGIATGGA